MEGRKRKEQECCGVSLDLMHEDGVREQGGIRRRRRNLNADLEVGWGGRRLVDVTLLGIWRNRETIQV